MNKTIVVARFGADNTCTLEFDGTITIPELLARTQAVLGHGVNVDVRINGVCMPVNAPLSGHETVDITPRAGTKGS